MRNSKRFILYLLIFLVGIMMGLVAFRCLIDATLAIVGTWSTASVNEEHYDHDKHTWGDDWQDYRTVFTADGKIGHYGNRTCDNGTWKWVGINKIKAEFTECYYAPVGEAWSCNAATPTYSCEYVLDHGQLYRIREGETEFTWQYLDNGARWEGIGSDLDHYNWPMKKRSEDTRLETYWDIFPEVAYFDETVEQNLLAVVPELMAGKEVILEEPDFPYEIKTYATCDLMGDGKEELFVLVQLRSMYSRGYQERSMLYIIALEEDGTYTILDKNEDLPTDDISMRADNGKMVYQCLLDGKYWDGPYLTLTFGSREGKVVVEKQEAIYIAHNYPYLLYESYDLKSGIFTVYTALDEIDRPQHFYAADEMTLKSKVYEEKFQGQVIPLSAFDIVGVFAPGEYQIATIKHLAYDVLAKEVRYMQTWWKHYHSGEEAPLWILASADEDPEEMLDQVAMRCDYDFKKISLPWSKETKENMERLMMCPMPDYYYESDYYALIYAQGDVRLYHKNYDSRGEKYIWVLDETSK